ncbi:HutD family protein [Escherichia coli]|nr:HutD family protein [Escherichia coli]MDW3472061.1 HutD family protein [Escherichia coli]
MDKPLQPWRNGGGVTRQLLAWPDDENWLLRTVWRMSVRMALFQRGLAWFVASRSSTGKG